MCRPFNLSTSIKTLSIISSNDRPEALNSVLEGLKECEKNYFTIAIIGGQNSGKSTLLNTLFKTDFQVLTGSAGTRTTRGVVLGRDFKENLILMDVEGNDSWENHVTGDEVLLI